LKFDFADGPAKTHTVQQGIGFHEIRPTPKEIVEGLFGPEHSANVHICSRTHDQDGSAWAGYRVSRRYPDLSTFSLPEDRDNYFCVGVMSPATRDRKAGNVIYDNLIVLDDVGTKAPQATVDGLLAFGMEPILVLESSPGNRQYFFRLDKPVDRFAPDDPRNAQMSVLRGYLGQGAFSDGAVHDPARYMRLPFGRNTKPKYRRADGTFPEVKLLEWNPDARVTLEHALDCIVGPGNWEPLVANYTPGSKPASANPGGGDRGASMTDAIVILARELGMDPHEIRPGVIEARCPNWQAHSGAADTGFAFINPYRGHCHHEHCKDLKAADFEALMSNQYEEAILDRVKRGELTDAENVLRDAAGEVVPRTARGFMARHQLLEVSPLTYSEMQVALKASESYAAKRAATPPEMRSMNERYFLCPSIDGVCDRFPVGEDSLHYHVINKAHFKTIHDRTKVLVSGKEVGLGTAWLGYVNATLFEAVGCWEVGQEPQGALNLWTGIPGAGDPVPPGATCDAILEYLLNVVAAGDAVKNAYALDWMAHLVQHPLEKHGVNLVLIGAQGTGKSTLGELLMDLFGAKFAMMLSSDQHLLGHFNAHLEGKVFLVLEEALFGKNPAIAGRYKALTTQPTMTIERKGIDARTVKNMLSMLICSNSLAGVPIEPGDRRATVFEVSRHRANDTAYFKALWNCWKSGGKEAFLHFLLARDLNNYDPRICLNTPEKAEMAEATADGATRFWLDLLSSGKLPSGKEWAGTPFLANRDLAAAHQAWATMNAQKALSSAELSRRIGDLCVSRRKQRASSGGREWGYVYPTLAECRDLASRAMGQHPD